MGSLPTTGAAAIDRVLRGPVDQGRLHNACFYACGTDGTLYSAAYGTRDVAGTQPIASDSVFWIASLTKLSTAISTLIAVDKGLISLDDNIREIVPELREIDILEGFNEDSGTPLLRKCTSPITLRQLLSHSSGFCYDLHHPLLKRWSAYVGKKEGTFSGSYKGYLHPLLFEPGEGWVYGPGMDWAGRTIELVANQDLESFMKANIWEPLGMDSTTFRPWRRPDMTERLVELAWRNPDGSLAKSSVPFGYPAEDCCGGVGLYSTPADQAKLMAGLVAGNLLGKIAMNELLRSQTNDPSHFRAVVCGSNRSHLGQTWPEGMRGDFGLSSCINEDAIPGRRAANSANWQGMPGIHAWLDRESGMAGLFVSQVLPPGDKVVTETFCALEEAAYTAFGRK